MALRYDFEFRSGDRGLYAMFSDPQTVEALRGADEMVQAYFVASGFRLTLPDAEGEDAAGDAARLEMVERLSLNLTSYAIGGREMNGFDFMAFMDHLEQSTPVRLPVARKRVLTAPFESARNAMASGVAAVTVATVVVWQGRALLGL